MPTQGWLVALDLLAPHIFFKHLPKLACMGAATTRVAW